MSNKGIESFKEIGFKKIGEFKKSKIQDEITIEIKYEDEYYKNKSEKYEFSYVFTEVDGYKEKIIYVGQSTQGCHNRFFGYVNAEEGFKQQSTNLKVKKYIKYLLEDKKVNKVNIYILHLDEEMKFREKIKINVYLGLEPALIEACHKDNLMCLNGKRCTEVLSYIEQKNKNTK